MSAATDRLREQLDQQIRNDVIKERGGLKGGGGPCTCARDESHDGRCLGADCYCHA
jgi:hypothetical protein